MSWLVETLSSLGRRNFAAIAVAVGPAACATASPQESRIRALLWDAATECARASSTITITDVDHDGRVWYSLSQGGQQDVPTWNACYHATTRESFGKEPGLAAYYRDQIAPRQR